MTHKLQYLDGFGCPLHKTRKWWTNNGSTSSLTVESILIIRKTSLRQWRSHYPLSLISLFMTLPFVHKDAHLANICVRDHHRLYNYTRGKIFELTWQAFGVYSVIDWNSSDVSCVRQNSISHFPIPLNKFTKDFERSYPWRRRRSITVIITSSYEQNWQDPVHTQIFGRYRKSHTSFVSFASNNFQQVLQCSGSCSMPNLRG